LLGLFSVSSLWDRCPACTDERRQECPRHLVGGEQTGRPHDRAGWNAPNQQRLNPV